VIVAVGFAADEGKGGGAREQREQGDGFDAFHNVVFWFDATGSLS
jgi:hypothetical protein